MRVAGGDIALNCRSAEIVGLLLRRCGGDDAARRAHGPACCYGR